ncbi:hypothetical protein CFIMG_007760RA00001 [Ceratocystis fimbriata CBS 114723]|uniref:Uncharacterized protein n=1 Tax=Ceratocystis fimbriata CBS 114723 TaxID=1035309 RepID=A0A2C5WV05_9PEZI|nr:hypothetical protein CFIMG_007760RA00001 [Ceratocystis fimbriata CBS 114723]
MNPSDRPRLRPRLRLPATPVPVAAPASDPSSLSLGAFLSTGSTTGPAPTASPATSPTASASATAAPSTTPASTFVATTPVATLPKLHTTCARRSISSTEHRQNSPHTVSIPAVHVGSLHGLSGPNVASRRLQPRRSSSSLGSAHLSSHPSHWQLSQQQQFMQSLDTSPIATRTATTNATAAAAPTTAPATAAGVPLFGGVVDFGFSKTPDGQRLRPHSRPPRRRPSLSPAPLHLVPGHAGGTPAPPSTLGRFASCPSSPPSSRSPSPRQPSVSMLVASKTYKHKPTSASAGTFTSTSTSKSTATATATGLDAGTTATTTLSGMRAAGDFHVDLLDDVEEMCQVMVSFGSVQDRLGRERERKSSRPLVQRPVRLRRRADGGVYTSPAAATAAASTGAVRDQIQ